MPCYCAMPHCMECNPPSQGLYMQNLNRAATLLKEQSDKQLQIIEMLKTKIVELSKQIKEHTCLPLPPALPEARKWDYSFSDDKE